MPRAGFHNQAFKALPNAQMKTIVLKVEADNQRTNAIKEAARCLAEGGLVVFPTETVYGVGANAANPAALARLRAVKERQETKPFTVHIGSRSAVNRFVPDLSGVGRRLTEKAWPGPLTVIFHVSDVTAAPILRENAFPSADSLYHDGTIGIRCPDDPIALDLLTAAGVPVVAASANPASRPAPVTAEEALATLDGKVDMVLDAGRTRYAKASTIVEVRPNSFQIIRDGVLDERIIRKLMQVTFLVVCSGNTCRSPMAEGILRKLVAEKLGVAEKELPGHGYNVESAGVSAAGGLCATPAAVRALASRGIDISRHKSQPLTLELVHRADYIFAMTDSHVRAIRQMAPQVRNRVRKIAQQDIEDPIGESDEVYIQVATQIEEALRERLEEVTL
jgi:tRNA threonylcarbamoyl adenosine modification protein (Sua5/YciO/YrdC/YwlC family)